LVYNFLNHQLISQSANSEFDQYGK